MAARAGLDGGAPTRRHAKRGSPSPATLSLLERWQAALRAELEAVLAELAPVPAEAGLLDAHLPAAPPRRPDLATRARLVTLGVQVAHELGTELDQSERPWEGLTERPRPRGRVDYG
jgi:hypothetical protein